MRFLTATLVVLSTLAATVFAQGNPITYPSGSDKIGAGQTIVIKWSPTTTNPTVTLGLRKGPSGNLGAPKIICDKCPNTGSFSWTAPKDLVAGKDYAIEIKYDGGVNYSPQFEVDSTNTARTTTTDTTATATDTTTTTTATTTATTEATTTHTSTTTSSTTTYPNTTLTTSTTSYPNVTATRSSTTTTSKPKTSTTSSTTGTGAPDPGNAGGLGKTVSGGLVVIVAAAWALML